MNELSGAPGRDSGDAWAGRSLHRWRWASATAAVSMLAILAWAPTKERFREWRRQQSRYNALAMDQGLAPVALELRQIWIPAAAKADRCGTCHLGMTGESPLNGHPPFEAHPPIAHPPESFGCTYCHSGQGRATDAADAHGEDGRWQHPIFDRERTEAGCGTCHSGVALPLPEDVEDGEDLVAELACLECHREGPQAPPSLDSVALKGIPKNWVALHRGLILPEDIRPLSGLADEEVDTLNAWLSTRIGAPHLARGKMVFQQLGCMGCHRRGGVGGDVGPELTQIGDKDARDVAKEPSGVKTLPEWLRQHLLTPQELVQDSRMPPLDTEELDRQSDIDDLVTYLLSLRGEVVPPELTPPDRARVLFGLGRDFPTGGRGVFESFCSACHGSEGEGAELETLGIVTPMIGTRGVLAMVTPRYFRDSMLRGRRGRYMPAWGPEDGGLSLDEIDSVVDYLFSQAFPVRPFETLLGKADAANGARVFEERCAFCHGQEQGPRFGRDLVNGKTLRGFSGRVLYGAITRGWAEEGMPSFSFLPRDELRDLTAFLRRRAAPTVGTTFAADRQHSHVGHQLWLAKCDGCHGERGEGGEGPMLNTAPYLAWADDAYLAHRIRNHGGGTAKAEIGDPSRNDIDAMVDYMRSWTGRISPAPAPSPDPAAVERGQSLYATLCTECHGEGGRGKTATAHASPDFRAVVTRPLLVMTILEGRKGTPMRAWREQKDNPVGVQDAYDLADYILSLGREGSATAPTSSAETKQEGG